MKTLEKQPRYRSVRCPFYFGFANRYYAILQLCLLFLLISESLSAQTKIVKNQQQIWIGYVTSTRISNHFALWNDIHYVPNGFFVARTGLTYSNIKNVSVTGGYAFALLPVSVSDTHLKRKEQRPWAQVVFTLPVTNSVLLTQRIRYDARFKEDVKDNLLEDSYTFTNRVRFMTSLKKSFGNDDQHKFTPFVMLADEVLLNFGKNVTSNTFDQNRIMLAVGLSNPKIQYQIGYMNRFVQVGVSQYVNNHMLVIWVTQKLAFKSRDSKSK